MIEHSGIAIKYYLYIQAMDLEVNANPECAIMALLN